MFKTSENRKIDGILPLLPTRVISEAQKLYANGKMGEINEIRLRANGLSSFTVSGKNEEIKNLYLTEKDIADTVYKLCSGSVYAHSEELKKGYISVGGIRVGVCGKALYGENGICGFSKYTSLNIRIPTHFADAAKELMEYISRVGADSTGGILVISPPCGGKTTLLRALAASLSKGYYEKGIYMKKRVCVIDEREEIFLPGVFDSGYADILSAYPKAQGIELCTRVMSPEYIVCDEIGNVQEAEAICDGASKGIIFAASCHGESLEEAMKRKGIKRLFGEEVFKTVCEIRCDGKNRRVKVRSVPC